MKIKQLKEKTIKGFIDFLPKIGINDIEGLLNALNDKLSKSEGGEVNKPIVITSKDSNYKIILSNDGTIKMFSNQCGPIEVLKASPTGPTNVLLKGTNLSIEGLYNITDSINKTIYDDNCFYANKINC